MVSTCGNAEIRQNVVYLRQNPSPPVKWSCDIVMEVLVLVHGGNYFSKRDSDSVLGIEEGHPRSRN